MHGEAFESQSFAAFTLDFLFCVLCLTVFFTEDLLCFLFNYNESSLSSPSDFILPNHSFYIYRFCCIITVSLPSSEPFAVHKIVRVSFLFFKKKLPLFFLRLKTLFFPFFGRSPCHAVTTYNATPLPLSLTSKNLKRQIAIESGSLQENR